jgi:hypothetical protein
MALGFFDAMFPLTVDDYGNDPGTRRLGDVLVQGKQYMATQEGFEWHGAGDTYVEHYLYHLLGDPTMQMWADPPVRFDPSRFRGVLRDIHEIKPIPEPGDPPFYIRFEFTGEPLAVGSLITVFRGGDEAIGRGIVGGDGTVNIIPDANVPPRDLSLSLQQDGAFPESEPVENQAPREQTTLTFTQPTNQISQTNNPNPFDGKLSPAFAGASVRVVYHARRSHAPQRHHRAHGDYGCAGRVERPGELLLLRQPQQPEQLEQLDGPGLLRRRHRPRAVAVELDQVHRRGLGGGRVAGRGVGGERGLAEPLAMQVRGQR